jgi:hypothetical protein
MTHTARNALLTAVTTLPALTAVAFPAQAAPFRVQADVGGFVNFSDEPFGERGRTLLGRFGGVSDPGLENDVVFGLTASYRPIDLLELGVSARRIGTGWRYALREEPSIAQRQDTTSYPLMALVGVRSAQDTLVLRLGAGAGLAYSEVSSHGYLEDADAESKSFCATGYAGFGLLTSIGVELGVELVYLHLTLPSTHPIMPVEGDLAVNGLVIGVTLGFQGE